MAYIRFSPSFPLSTDLVHAFCRLRLEMSIVYSFAIHKYITPTQAYFLSAFARSSQAGYFREEPLDLTRNYVRRGELPAVLIFSPSLLLCKQIVLSTVRLSYPIQ